MISHYLLNPHLRSAIALSNDVSNDGSPHSTFVEFPGEGSHPTIIEGGSITPFRNHGVDPVPPAILTWWKKLLVA